jgi:hypothetical protein
VWRLAGAHQVPHLQASNCKIGCDGLGNRAPSRWGCWDPVGPFIRETDIAAESIHFLLWHMRGCDFNADYIVVIRWLLQTILQSNFNEILASFKSQTRRISPSTGSTVPSQTFGATVCSHVGDIRTQTLSIPRLLTAFMTEDNGRLAGGGE